MLHGYGRRAKIGLLMDEIRRNGPNPELVDAIVDLSMRYGVVTPYTSYLVEEPDERPVANSATESSVPPQRGLDLSHARAAVAEEAAAEAAAPASGEAAVMASQAREKLLTATAIEKHSEVRFAGGRAFVSQDTVTLPDGSQELLGGHFV